MCPGNPSCRVPLLLGRALSVCLRTGLSAGLVVEVGGGPRACAVWSRGAYSVAGGSVGRWLAARDVLVVMFEEVPESPSGSPWRVAVGLLGVPQWVFPECHSGSSGSPRAALCMRARARMRAHACATISSVYGMGRVGDAWCLDLPHRVELERNSVSL